MEEIDDEKYYNIPDVNDHIFPERETKVFMDHPRYFTDVVINPRTLLGIIRHSLTTSNEIIGMALGHFLPKSHWFFLTDCINLPVVGEGFRVAAPKEALGVGSAWPYLLDNYGRLEKKIGWYHSHPNLHVFYSKTDCNNHYLHWKAMLGTYVGLVIDPINTIVSGHLHLGAYSTLDPDAAKKMPPPSIDVIKKYGNAANYYYQLNIHFYCSKSDKVVLNDIIKKSYATALKDSPLSTNAKAVIDSDRKSKQSIDDSNDRDPVELKDKLSNVNSTRQSGLWIHRKKRLVFG